MPDWPGREGFGGRVLHSGEYRNAEPFRGLRVLVVGAGNSGSDIALDLAAGGAPAGVAFGAAAALPGAAPGARRPGAGRRARPAPAANAGLRRACGIGAARVHRQPRRPPAAGHREPRSSAVAAARGRCRSSMRGSFPGCATARFGSSLGRGVRREAGRPRGRPLRGAGCGDRCDRYRLELDALVGHLGLLDRRGEPRVHGADTDPAAPGMHFTGFRNPITGALRELRYEATAIAQAVQSR
jgi:putative flavoprotein involved in K+ transport